MLSDEKVFRLLSSAILIDLTAPLEVELFKSEEEPECCSVSVGKGETDSGFVGEVDCLPGGGNGVGGFGLVPGLFCKRETGIRTLVLGDFGAALGFGGGGFL
mmetsp:Transcript_44685/g.62642  ORF Transcript_44685/g.62642 Transcript_44685/m.62642 type:complete len:102 (-) Transcript_44685:152-457(-)